MWGAKEEKERRRQIRSHFLFPAAQGWHESYQPITGITGEGGGAGEEDVDMVGEPRRFTADMEVR